MKEDVSTEFKREFTKDIAAAAIAFANTEGGHLYVGIEDDGRICGVADPEADLLRIQNLLRDAVRPDITMFSECHAETMEGKAVLVLQVRRGTARPYYLHSKGVRPEGVYVRQGASSVPASLGRIQEMIRQTGNDHFENERSLVQDLTFHAAEAAFAAREMAFGPAQKQTLHLIGEDGTYTNLGLLLSDQCRHTTKIAVFEGRQKSAAFRDRIELTGSLLKQADDAYAFLDRYNSTRSTFQGLHRSDLRDYPEAALREALLNAIAHRDYTYPDATLIHIFEDRMELVTLGGLIGRLTLEDILNGVSALRNAHLANVFYRLHLIEAYGTGMMKIRDSYAEAAVAPTFYAAQGSFRVVLPNRNVAIAEAPQDPAMTTSPSAPPSERPDRETLILRLLDERTTLTRREAQEALGISQSTANATLRTMVEKGLLKREGNGRTMRYRRRS